MEKAKEKLAKVKVPPAVVKEKAKAGAKKQAAGFVDFIRTQGVVGLAVGLVIGVAAKSVVDSFVNNIFNPVVGLMTGGVNLSDKYLCLKFSGAECVTPLRYGQLISDIISFLIVALAIYLIVHMLHLDKLDKKKDS